MGRSSGGMESLFVGWVGLILLSSVLMTLVGGIWIHWCALFPTLFVGLVMLGKFGR